MKARLLVSAVGIPLLLFVVLKAPIWCMTACVMVLSLIGCYELLYAVGKKEWKTFLLFPLLAGFQTWAVIQKPHWVGVLAFAIVVLAFCIAILRYGTQKQVHFHTLTAALFGATAIPSSFACLVLLRELSPALTLTPFIAAFCSDSMALFAGLLCGKHKLAPAVSPKKTIEGSVGGFLGAVLGMVIWQWFAQGMLPLHTALLMGVLGSFLGQLGDLSFSVIKREFQIKDYGKLMPGHGGVLDRFDSVLFVTPAFWLFLCMQFG